MDESQMQQTGHSREVRFICMEEEHARLESNKPLLELKKS